jgi:hypothetical protein
MSTGAPADKGILEASFLRWEAVQCELCGFIHLEVHGSRREEDGLQVLTKEM